MFSETPSSNMYQQHNHTFNLSLYSRYIFFNIFFSYSGDDTLQQFIFRCVIVFLFSYCGGNYVLIENMC